MTTSSSSSSSLPSRYKPYSRYKDSGVDWLGEVPKDWEVKRLRYMAQINPSKSEVDDLDLDQAVSFLPMESIGEDGSLDLDTARPLGSVYQGFTYFRDNDVLIAKITPCFENGKGAIAENLRNGIGFGTTELHVLRSGSELDRRFLFYLTASFAFRQPGEAWMYGAGGQKRVPDDFVLNFRSGFPPQPEQRAIAEFLDRETAKIDKLIATKEQLIELLEEQRSALITHAVTRGLDPNTPLRDSGIEWLGQIPTHWKVLPVRGCFRRGRGRVISHEEIHENPGEYPVYSSQTENDGIMGFLDSYDFEGNYLTWTTDGAKAGTVFRRSDRFNCTNVCGTLKASRPDIDLAFAHRALNLATRSFVRHDINPKLMNEVMAAIRFPVPPIKEQLAITQWLEARFQTQQQLTAQIRLAIEKLKEYRAALTTSAVTGKIDVRNGSGAAG
jgi:type I restriction enzyme S subunit